MMYSDDLTKLRESLLIYKAAMQAVEKAKELCVKIVKEEPELPGEMTDDMFHGFKNANKEELHGKLVKLVQLTKNNIINRINKVVQ